MCGTVHNRKAGIIFTLYIDCPPLDARAKSATAFPLSTMPVDRSLRPRADNRLLAVLAQADYERIAPHLEFAPVALGEVLYESGGRMEHAYFPTTSIVSLLYVMADGASAEIAVVGNDGIVGISMLHGRRIDPEPRGRAERRRRLPAQRASSCSRNSAGTARPPTCCCATRRR